MTKFTSLLLVTGIVAGVMFTLPPASVSAQSDSWNALYDRIIRLEHEIRSLKGAGGAGAPQGDVNYRLSTIEEQLRQLLGKVNSVGEQMRDMRSRIKRLEERRSGRLVTEQPVSSQSSLNSLPEETYTPQSDGLDLTVLPETTDPLPGGVVDGTQFQTQFEPAPEPQVLGQLIIRNDGGLPDNGLQESTLLPGQVESAALDNPTASAGSTPEDLYERSYKSLLGRRFGLAEAGFKTFLSQNRKHRLASKAQYWLGETYYVQGRHKQAAQSFLTGYKSYPRGARAPESLLKLGMSLNKLGQAKQACGALAEVSRSYPSAKAARRQAAKEIKRAGC